MSISRSALPAAVDAWRSGHAATRWSACAPRAGCWRRCAPRGFGSSPVPSRVGFRRLAHAQTFRDLVRLLRAERPDLVHAHMPISGFLARLAAWLAGVPRVAYTCHGFCSISRTDRCCAARTASPWNGSAARITDVVPDGLSQARRRMRAGCTSFATPSPSAMAATRQCSVPTRRRVQRIRAALGVLRRTRWWCSRCRGWFATRAIRNWPPRCASCRRRSFGW